jgi:hypothetical protein
MIGFCIILPIILAITVWGGYRQGQKRKAYIAQYMEQCVRDYPAYECDMRVKQLKAAWSASDDAAIAASMAATSAALNATTSTMRR